MTNEPWGLGATYPPPMLPPHGYTGYPGQFGAPPPPAPPSLAATIIVTILAGVFGVIPASLHASRAQQLGFPGGRYWKAFGITFGAHIAAQVLLLGGLVAAGLVTLVPLMQLGTGTAAGGSDGSALPSAPAVSRTPVAPPTTSVPSSPAPPPVPERTGRDEPTRTPSSVSVVTGSGGDACVTGAGQSAWGGYPLASCRTWKASNGLVTGAPLSRKSLSITCQANLQEPNPIYTAGQANTWWVWTQADNGTWDWFPETAIAQGSSNQPINGIARCQ